LIFGKFSEQLAAARGLDCISFRLWQGQNLGMQNLGVQNLGMQNLGMQNLGVQNLGVKQWR
jgi:Pentapeptide repeats (8 copies)